MTSAIACICFTIAYLAWVLPAGAEDLLLKNASVIDPEKRTVERRDIYITGGKLAAPESVRGNVHVVDLTGKWIIPGLIDMHVHYGGNPFPNGKHEDLGPVGTAKRMLYAGVVAYLDCAGDPVEFFAARDKQRLEPEKTADQADLYGAGTAFGRWNVKDPKEAPSVIHAYIQKFKPDIIKFIYAQDTLTKECLQSGLKEAQKEGVKTVVHIGNWEHARDAIEGGATVVTHLYDDEVIPDDLVETWAKSQTLSVPTMAVQCDMARFAANPHLLEVPLLQQIEPQYLLRSYYEQSRFNKRALSTIQWQKQDTANDMKSFHKMSKAGIPLLAGSDTNNMGTIQGFSLHRELQLMHEGGYSNWQALAGATTQAARFLGRASGINLGDTAELVILDADPLDSISNTQKIWAVFHRGKQVDRNALLSNQGKKRKVGAWK